MEDLLINLFLTALFYMIFPFVIFFSEKNNYTKQRARTYAIINSIVIWMFFVIFHIVLDDIENINSVAPFLYGYVNFLILKKHAKEEEKTEENKKD